VAWQGDPLKGAAEVSHTFFDGKLVFEQK